MGRVYLTFSGIGLCSDNNMNEIKNLQGLVNLQRSPFEVKSVLDAGVIANLIIDYADDVFIGVFSAWLYDKIKNSKTEIQIFHRNNYLSVGRIDVTINKRDTQQEVKEKLIKIANLPEKNNF